MSDPLQTAWPSPAMPSIHPMDACHATAQHSTPARKVYPSGTSCRVRTLFVEGVPRYRQGLVRRLSLESLAASSSASSDKGLFKGTRDKGWPIWAEQGRPWSRQGSRASVLCPHRGTTHSLAPACSASVFSLCAYVCTYVHSIHVPSIAPMLLAWHHAQRGDADEHQPHPPIIMAPATTTHRRPTSSPQRVTVRVLVVVEHGMGGLA